MLGNDLPDRAEPGDRDPLHVVFRHLGKSPG